MAASATSSCTSSSTAPYDLAFGGVTWGVQAFSRPVERPCRSRRFTFGRSAQSRQPEADKLLNRTARRPRQSTRRTGAAQGARRLAPRFNLGWHGRPRRSLAVMRPQAARLPPIELMQAPRSLVIVNSLHILRTRPRLLLPIAHCRSRDRTQVADRRCRGRSRFVLCGNVIP